MRLHHGRRGQLVFNLGERRLDRLHGEDIAHPKRTRGELGVTPMLGEELLDAARSAPSVRASPAETRSLPWSSEGGPAGRA